MIDVQEEGKLLIVLKEREEGMHNKEEEVP